MKTRSSRFVALTTLAALTVVASAALTGPSRPAGADAPKAVDPAQVKTLYGEKCSACHNLPKPEEKGYTRPEWHRTVNTMLNKYHASDSISPTEAAQIVDYLATFAPKNNMASGRRGSNPWATDGLDVWTDAPTATRVYNFEAGGLSAGLAPVGSGTPGPAPVWQIATDRPGADGSVARVSAPAFRADRFALLVDRADQGRNMDVRVRFRIESGKSSPAVGLVFGYADPNTYTVLRCNQTLGDLALIQISGASHTTVQQTPLVLAPPAPNNGGAGLGGGAGTGKTGASPGSPLTPPLLGVGGPPPAPTPLAPGWHTLRLLVHDGQVRGWLDMQKRINTTLPNYSGGKIGLWSQGNTSASFDDWTVDLYDDTKTPPLS